MKVPPCVVTTFSPGGAADTMATDGITAAADEFQRWKRTVSVGKFWFRVDDPKSIPPREEWEDRELDEKHVEKLCDIAKNVGALAEKSVWVIDSKPLRDKHLHMGAGMFTVKFCTGEDENGEDDATHEQILAWAENQIRERL